MAISSLESYNAMLKDDYLMGSARSQLNEGTILLSNMEKFSEFIDSTGRRAVFPALIARPQGAGATSENGDLPDATPSKTQGVTIDLSYQFLRLQFSIVALEKALATKGAFADLMTFEMDQSIPTTRRDINRQAFGTGAGDITRIGNSQSGSTFTVDNTASLEDGMKVDIYTMVNSPIFTDATLILSNVIINTVDDVNGTVTLNTSLGITTANPSKTYIFRKGSKGMEAIGLRGAVDDGSTLDSYCGVSRTSTPRWKGGVFNKNVSATAITEQLLFPAWRFVKKTGMGPDFGITNFDLVDNLAITMFTEKRFNDVEATKLKGGYKGLQYNDIVILQDEQAPGDRVFFLSKKTWMIHQTDQLKWDELSGSILTRVSGKPAYEALMFWFMNFACSRPNANSVTLNLK